MPRAKNVPRCKPAKIKKAPQRRNRSRTIEETLEQQLIFPLYGSTKTKSVQRNPITFIGRLYDNRISVFSVRKEIVTEENILPSNKIVVDKGEAGALVYKARILGALPEERLARSFFSWHALQDWFKTKNYKAEKSIYNLFTEDERTKMTLFLLFCAPVGLDYRVSVGSTNDRSATEFHHTLRKKTQAIHGIVEFVGSDFIPPTVDDDYPSQNNYSSDEGYSSSQIDDDDEEEEEDNRLQNKAETDKEDEFNINATSIPADYPCPFADSDIDSE
jgi:hypothetical protein